jgi:RNA polymerase sigma factor (sigma-70 family)
MSTPHPDPLPPSPTDRAALSDEELMTAYATQDDAAAFDVLYERHERGLYRFVRRLLGVQAGEGDEVYQEAWIRIVTARAEFPDQQAPWRAWAFAIAHNLALDRLGASGRKVRFIPPRQHEVGSVAGAGSRPAGTAEPISLDDDAALWRSVGRRLLDCVNQMPAEQRSALLLRHEHGFTDDMLAETLGLGADVVYSAVQHGTAAMQVCMESADADLAGERA